MPLHLDPKAKGKYIKLGHRKWVRLADISNATVLVDGLGKHLRVKLKDIAQPFIYRGNQVDYVRQALTKENIP